MKPFIHHHFKKDDFGNLSHVLTTNSEAYARAALAAPDLYDALYRVIQDIDAGWAHEADKRFPWLKAARAAIAKAEGGKLA